MNCKNWIDMWANSEMFPKTALNKLTVTYTV